MLAYHPWPVYDAQLLVMDTITWVVQVNGKVRAKLTTPAAITDDAIKAQALNDAAVQRWLDGKPPRDIIVIPKKLINVVI